MDGFRQDLRYAWRTLRTQPGFALVVVVTLALGIGANTALFSVVDAVLLRPLPYAEPERLVRIWPESMVPQAGYVEMEKQTRAFERLAGVGGESDLVLTGRGEPERLRGVPVTASLFPMLGVNPAAGRALLPGENAPGSDRVVVLSHALWQQRFGGSPEVIGSTLTLDGVPRTVVGVMPAGFRFPSRSAQLWIPAAIDPGNAGQYWNPAAFQLYARLRPGATPEAGLAEVRTVVPRLRASFPWPMPDDWGASATVVSMRDQLVGGVRAPLLILLGAVGLVLLIACANVANLLLARAVARQKELATRAALGAGRGRLLRQVLTESLLLSAAGGAAGLAVAFAGVGFLRGRLPPDTPRLDEIGIDLRVLAFTSALALAVGLLFGILPAVRASGTDVQESMRDAGKGAGTHTAHRRGSGLLVVSQVALSMVLVAAAGLLIQSLWRLQHIDPGFRTEGVVTARLTPAGPRYQDPGQALALYRQVVDRVGNLPGVTEAAAVNQLPLDGGFSSFPFEVEGRPTAPGAAPPMARSWVVTPGYLGAMRIPLLRGRGIEEADREDAPGVALVNEAFARQFWPGEDPTGKRLKPVWWQDRWLTVVGVVGNVRHEGLAGDDRPEVYRPLAQEPSTQMLVVARGSGDPAAFAAGLRSAVAAVDADVPVSDVRGMDQVVSASLAEPRFTMVLLSLFAGAALLLGSVGIYGVTAYAVSQRRHEIGVRMALGAGPGRILGMVVRSGAVLAGGGIAAGLLAALAATRLLEHLLYGVSPADPVTFVLVAVVILVVTLVASYIPARRAARVDPTVALRME